MYALVTEKLGEAEHIAVGIKKEHKRYLDLSEI